MDRVGGLYGALAPIYDEWQSCDGMIPFAEVVRARLEPTLRGIQTGALSFLDVGAGTGTLLVGLREQHPGWRLAGVDDSAAMLAVAVRKPDAASITWARARLDGSLPFGPTFGAMRKAKNPDPVPRSTTSSPPRRSRASITVEGRSSSARSGRSSQAMPEGPITWAISRPM